MFIIGMVKETTCVLSAVIVKGPTIASASLLCSIPIMPFHEPFCSSIPNAASGRRVVTLLMLNKHIEYE